MSNRLIRQRDLIKCDLSTPICVIGAGGIGSFLVLTLAKMGFTNIDVYDDDMVEEHNLPNQFYRESDIGTSKVVALTDLVYAFTGTRIRPHSCRWSADDEDFTDPYVMISAVDNMETRTELFAYYQTTEACKIFMDGRMGADQIEVYTVADNDMARSYGTKLWRDDETSPVPCTSRATMYTVLQISAIMADHLRLVLSGEQVRMSVIMDMFNMKMY